MAHAKHDYHILPPSIWPFMAAGGAFAMLFGAVNWMHGSGPWLFLIGFAAVLYVMYGWWADVVTESQQGDHTPVVRLGLKYGFIMFIMSEVMFFAAWFWAFFKHAIYPMNTYEASTYVPPEIYAVRPVSSAADQHARAAPVGLRGDVVAPCARSRRSPQGCGQRSDPRRRAGLIFTGLQAFEYWELIAHYDWTFGGDKFFSTFFLATGFHGLHVIIGTIFLFICWLRVLKGHFTPEKHIGFEAAAWYWHFVDVVWLFLFAAVYIWGQAVVIS